jgi:ring-1,2-phenylacetyl-CoA epoxidase subunit PaaC
VAIWLELLYERLQASLDTELAGIAAKSLKEVRYHRQHSSDWVVRLGDGTDESKARMQAALNVLWPYFNELFAADGVDGVGPAWNELEAQWRARWATLMQEATLTLPRDAAMQPRGIDGIHSEHMGHMLATMQFLQRTYPGGVW